ncbi:anti-virulence regulator CigR family protein [Pseudomonas protegens]|uniref:anti-virulence regulator CigR family protein n=1 Tax=Pseudomonas protegens TaxID=380021 RepID=UPI003FD81C47
MHTSRPLVTVLACLFLAAASPLVLADPGGGKGQGHSNDDWSHGPSIDRGNVLGILGGHRDYWSPGPALPPGIQKNLARGKPLPPGIAKKLDSRLLGQLPRYEGYEWRQAGTDLILVAIASGVIYEVLNDVLN